MVSMKVFIDLGLLVDQEYFLGVNAVVAYG
jgi:hypothetical protein